MIPVGILADGNWTENVYRKAIVKQWLRENEVEYQELKSIPHAFPYAFLMEEESVVAFKLRFEFAISAVDKAT